MLFHHPIFFGFLALLIATHVAMIHIDTPFKIFTGALYATVSLLADIGGVAIVIGVIIAFFRRYIQKPWYLQETKPYREMTMYIYLLVLVIVGFALEAIRIEGTLAYEQEKWIAPIGSWLSLGLRDFSQQNLVLWHRGLWLFHMISTMVFVAVVAFTKFSHIIQLPFASLVTPPRRGAILPPMDFENEEAESFGLGNVEELTIKNRLDTLTCIECGRCSEVCPALIAGKPLDPKLIVTKMRDHMLDGQKTLWEEKMIYSADELDACTTCGACMEECPANIEHVHMIMELKRYKALTLGEFPTEAVNAMTNIETNNNPWGIAGTDRFLWADNLDLPIINPDKEVDYLFYVGCAGSYDSSMQKAVKASLELLKMAGIDFALLGENEPCCGDPLRRLGNEYAFYELAVGNIELFNSYKFKEILVVCPHGMHTIGKEYGQFGGNFTVTHVVDLFDQLIKNGKLKPIHSLNEKPTYHDPCYLGRHDNNYTSARSIIKSIPGIKYVELPRNKDRSLCCGMGGGNMWYEINDGQHLAKARMEEIGDAKISQVLTACPYCMINFDSQKSSGETNAELAIQDIALMLYQSVTGKSI